MEDISKYKLINSCENFSELAIAIPQLGNVNNEIKGKNRYFSVENQLKGLELIRNNPDELYYLSGLTRNYGIRQQAIYLLRYGER